MRTRLLTTTALAVALLLPVAALAQDAREPATVMQNEVAAPTDTRRLSGTDQALDVQNLRGALAKLEDAQQRSEQVADGNTRHRALNYARADSLDAIAQIERTLHQYPDPADNPKVSIARRATDETRAMLQHDRRPGQVARVLGNLHSAVVSLLRMSGQ